MLRALPRAALFATLVLVPALALGEERLTLKWSAPAECPGESDVKAEVDRLLGSSRATPKKPVSVSAKVTKDTQGTWHVRLETPGDLTTRSREIHGASCRAISDATALILALMIDPEAALVAPPASSSTATAGAPGGTGASVPPAAPGASSEAPAQPSDPTHPPIQDLPSNLPTPGASVPASSPSAPQVSAAVPLPGVTLPVMGPFPPLRRNAPLSPDRLPVGFRAGLWAGADAGSLPGVSAGFGILAALMLGAQRIEVGFAVRPPAKSFLAARPTAGGSVDLLSGSLGTCRRLLARPVELSPCVSFEAGRMHAVGFGVTTPGQAEQPWVALGAGGLLEWSPAARLSFLLRVNAVVPLARSTFVLEGVGAVHQPSPVAGPRRGRRRAGILGRFRAFFALEHFPARIHRRPATMRTGAPFPRSRPAP